MSFRYGCRANVLDELNLRIPAGETVAIVGESGCGKSTLLKLLMRFYDPTDGPGAGRRRRPARLRPGQPRAAASASCRRSRSSSTARCGRTSPWGSPSATLNEVIAAARAAGLEEFIAGLPERYETIIGERGANLSGGQRQRLAIARALLRKPDLLIFDEATSHLDTATERAIQENLRTACWPARRCVLVAHRLCTIRDADLIYVMHRRARRRGRDASAVARPRGLLSGTLEGPGERRAPRRPADRTARRDRVGEREREREWVISLREGG